VRQLKAIVDAERQAGIGPDVVIVGSRKPGGYFPTANGGPPILGGIDLGCFVVKRNVWAAHCDHYGRRYEGDFDFIDHLWRAVGPNRFSWHNELHFVNGEASRGRYEGQWP
jgi:hypothetical protein